MRIQSLYLWLVANKMTHFIWDLERNRRSFLVLFLFVLSHMRYRRLADPLISHGRHFGRTLHAFCNIQTLLTNGLKQMSQSANEPEETFTPKCVIILSFCHLFNSVVSRQQREHDVFQALLKMVPGLEERLAEGIEGDVATIAEMVSHEHCISTILC
jgi:hypothetical protein